MNRTRLILSFAAFLLAVSGIYTAFNPQSVSLLAQLPKTLQNAQDNLGEVSYYLLYDEPAQISAIPRKQKVGIKPRGEAAFETVAVLSASVVTVADSPTVTQLTAGNPQVLGTAEISEDYLNRLILNNLAAAVAAGWIATGNGGVTTSSPVYVPATYVRASDSTRFSSTELFSQHLVTEISTVNNLLTTKDLMVTRDVSIAGDLDVTGTITGNISGTINPGLAAGSILFQAASGIAEDNSNFFWDNTNNRLGIGTNTPSEKLDVAGNAKISGTLAVGGSNTLFVNPTTNVVSVGSTTSYANTPFSVTGSSSGTVLPLLSLWNNASGVAGAGAALRLQTHTSGNYIVQIASENESGTPYFQNPAMTFSTMNGASGVAALQERMRISSIGNVGIGTSNPQNKLSVAASDADNNLPAFSVTRTLGATASNPLVTAQFRNTGDAVGGSDYQNEVHLVLQAGTTSSHRRYLNFRDYNGIDKWVNGVNAINSYILYDAADTLHRFVLYDAANGGASEINSAGTGAIEFNKSASDGVQLAGTGGINLWSGGAYASQYKTLHIGTDNLQYSNNNSLNAGVRFEVTAAGNATISANSGNPLTLRGSTNSTVGAVDNTGKTAWGGAISSVASHSFINTIAASSGVYNGMSMVSTLATSADNSSIQSGFNSSATISGSNQIRYISNVNSITYSGQNTSSILEGTNTTLIYSGVGTISQLTGLNVTLNVTNAGGTVGTGYGIHVNAPTVTGAITTLYGIRVEEQGANKWGIYSAGPLNKNYFGGNVGIGTTSPTAKLQVLGTGSFSAAGVSALNLGAHTANLTASPATFRAAEIGAMTLDAVSAQTVTTASSLYVATPVAGSNVTITNNKPIDTQTTAYLSSGGTWTNASSRELKENFTALDPNEVLDKIDSLNIERWNYKAEDRGTTHIGPVAEEFHAVFDTGGIEGDKAISTIDPAGIALLGIQGLSAKVKTLLDMSWIIDGFKQFGIEINQELTKIKSLAVEKLQIGSADKPSGFVMYDEDTNESYCVKIRGGEFVKIKGECDETTEPSVSTSAKSAANQNTIEAQPAETTVSESAPITEETPAPAAGTTSGQK